MSFIVFVFLFTVVFGTIDAKLRNAGTKKGAM
jgi:hypothetical protein